MRYVAAYLLCALAGKTANADDIRSILKSAGINAEDEKINKVINEMKDKKVENVISEGLSKLSTMPATCASTGPATSSAASSGDTKPAPATAKKEEEEEQSDEDMGFGLFD